MLREGNESVRDGSRCLETQECRMDGRYTYTQRGFTHGREEYMQRRVDRTETDCTQGGLQKKVHPVTGSYALKTLNRHTER